MEKELNGGKMDLNMKAHKEKKKNMDLGFTSGLMEANLKDNGERIKSQALAYILG